MQVDNPVLHQPYFSSPSSLNDFSDIFNADLFADDIVNGTLNATNSPATASSSRGSSPQSPYQSSLLTPPQPAPAHSFPEFNPSSFFNFDDEIQAKQLDPMMSINNVPYDFFGGFAAADIGIDGGMGLDVNMDMSGINTGVITEAMGIDPQLVGTPSAVSDEDQSEHIEDVEQDADVSESPSPEASTTTTKATKARSTKKKDKEPEATDEEQEKLTLVIQPVKAGGHGKARKGTVQSGGIVKKTSTPNPVSATLGKENTYNVSAPFVLPPTFTPTNKYQPTNVYNHNQKKTTSEDGKDEDEDDLPQDWRPSPEVFAKMTSKEKRQLRNKISARNFRVRRKEYISTLEGDIAERDRILDAIRSELGSTQSENLALRQEIAALKRTLLEGRASSTSPDGTEYPLLNLPPPAPLPAQSAAATLQAQAQQQQQQAQQQQAAALLTPNTQKDASKNGRFWGGVRLGMGMGGVTPVHRVVLPEVSVADLLQSQFAPSPFVTAKDDKWKENMNPLLNGLAVPALGKDKLEKEKAEQETINKRAFVEKEKTPFGFDGFADVNPFTMKTIDAYRMHLWGKMASQQQQQHHQQQLLQHQHQQAVHQHHLTGLASSLRPAFFSNPTASSPLASLLSGKHTPPSPAPPYSHSHSTTPATPPPPYSSPPPSPVLLGKGVVVEKLERERREMQREKERERERLMEREKEKETAMYAALASQTLLRKLGGAFWDAFSGSSHSSAPAAGAGASTSSAGTRSWDADKVRKVLEGKAVVRVVDIEEPQVKVQEQPKAQTQQKEVQHSRIFCPVTMSATAELLEESMRSLTLNKKS
ncbi:hypothetical protein H0H87_009676 [Tephrocybe sp. NHM501043]|nr:hypothetical protein H0H87_009676 [Tephrocybe sp. NHM501043]